MATQVTQFNTAIQVIPSDLCSIPYPAIITAGTATSTVAGQLVDSEKDFVKTGIQTGDIVYIYGAGIGATVESVSTNVLVLNSQDVSSGDEYLIFKGGDNNGCTLYISGVPEGNTSKISVETLSGSQVIFNDVVTTSVDAGVFFPVQVTKVFSTDTTNTNIIALW